MFKFRYMQTDPNWSNFFYNPNTKQVMASLALYLFLSRNFEPFFEYIYIFLNFQLILLDFGASRSYEKKFIDQYLQVVKAALDGDRKKVLAYSEKMGFLTGYESKVPDIIFLNIGLYFWDPPRWLKVSWEKIVRPNFETYNLFR